MLVLITRLNKLITSISVLTVVLLFAVNASALTVEQAIEKIVNNSPELRIILEKREQSVTNYEGTRADYMPSLRMEYTRTYTKSDPITDPSTSSWVGDNKFELILEQKIFDMETLSRIARSSYLVQTQEFQNQKLLESLIQLAITSYYDVVQAEYVSTVSTEHLRLVREIESLVLNMRNQGNATLGDVNLVQSRVAEANTNVILANANLLKVKTRLAYLLNLISPDMEGNVDVDKVLPDLENKDFYDLADKMTSFIPISVEDLQREGIRNNVDVLLIRSNLCAAGYQLESQKARYLPTLGLKTTLRSEEDKSSNDSTHEGEIKLEAKYYIFDGGARRAGVKNAESSIRELEYQYDVQVRDIRDNAYTVFSQLKSLEQQRVSVLKEIESAEEVDKIYTQQFQFGTRNLTDKLDNLDRLLQSRIRLIQTDYNVLSARIQVLTLVGTFVEFFGFQNYLDTNNLELC